MCEALDIKIAIMRRYWKNAPYDMMGDDSKFWAAMPLMISTLLGVEVSYNLIRYTCMTAKDVIVSDISKGLPIAIELDTLKPNWN